MTRTLDARRAAAVAFLATGLVSLAYAASIVVGARTYQAIEERRFQAERLDVADAGPPGVVDGHAIGEIQIPRILLSAMIAQGDSPAILRHAVGHLADSALPGERGNVVLAGHRDSFFRPLKDIRAGDVITLKTLGGDFAYRVESTAVVPPTDVQVLEPTGGRTLTLVTCFPFSYLGAAPDRFIVRARQVDGRPATGR